MPGRSTVASLCLIGLLAAGTLGMTADADAPTAPHARDDLRAPWTRSNERHIRTWRAAGELVAPKGEDGLAFDFLTAQGGESAAAPEEGQPLVRPDGTTVAWTTYVSWDDRVSLEEAVGQYPFRTGIAYAFAKVTRASDGPALLSVGSDEGIRIWVNGALAHEHRGRRAMTYDEDRVEVAMVAGENRILVKTEQTMGAWDFSLRVLEPGARLARYHEITPSIVDQPDASVLVVQTDSSSGAVGQAPVTVEIVGPGGTVWATQTRPRGETARFETGAWPQGVAEVRCTTQRPDGRTYAAHFPYYNGKAVISAQPLIDAAKAAAKDATRAGLLTKMLATMALDRLDGKTSGPWHRIHSPLMEWEELKLEAAGKGSASRSYGFARLAYVDEVDGTPQYARAYLPAGYDDAKPWPLVIQLHGFNGQNPEYVRWWSVGERHNEYAENLGVIWLEPHGRGNTGYRGMGERDVLRAIELAKERFNVDPDRVYLTGDSMGGWGTWHVGTRHPELFAAIAPTFGGADYRVDIPDEVFAQMSARQRFMAERTSSFAQAEALLNVPILILHGDADEAVNVEYSRWVTRLLQRWGYDVRYWELPGFGHEDLPARIGMVEWFLGHTRKPQPRHVRVRAAELKSASAHWVRVTRSMRPFRFVNAEAEVTDNNVIRLDTDNVAEIALAPTSPLIDRGQPVTVVWNGAERVFAADGSEAFVLRAAGVSPAPVHKRPSLEGPIENLHATPFAIVIGTVSADPRMRAMCATKGEVLAGMWETWQKHRPRVFRDKDLSDADAARYSLLLIGGPEANAVTRRIADKLPLAISADAVTIDGRSFEARDAAVQIVYPSPLSPERYVSVVAGTSADGLYFWDPILFDDSPAAWDYVVLDGRTNSGAGELPVEMRRIASGVFDQDWRLDDAGLVEGDAAVRAQNSLARAPQADARVIAKDLAELVGRYEVEPGNEVVITRRGPRLFAQTRGYPSTEIVPVGDDELAYREVSVRFLIKRDESGKPKAVVVRSGGEESEALRVAETTP